MAISTSSGTPADILSPSDVDKLNAYLDTSKPWFRAYEDARLKLHFHQSALRQIERRKKEAESCEASSVVAV